MNKTHTVKICDICHRNVDYNSGFEDANQKYKDHAYTDSVFSNYQTFYANGKVIETCVPCCNAIKFAINNLGVEYDDSELWLRAGFERVGDEWKYKDRDENGYIVWI